MSQEESIVYVEKSAQYIEIFCNTFSIYDRSKLPYMRERVCVRERERERGRERKGERGRLI